MPNFPRFERQAERRFDVVENNLTVVAAELRTAPALKKLARAYIALARQFRGQPEVKVPVIVDTVTRSREPAP
jgi:hypothetical protein